MKDLLARLSSRKFLLAALGIVTVFLNGHVINLSQDQINAIIDLILAFTAAEGVADIVSRYNENKSTKKGVA